jgi:hypothetical protein
VRFAIRLFGICDGAMQMRCGSGDVTTSGYQVEGLSAHAAGRTSTITPSTAGNRQMIFAVAASQLHVVMVRCFERSSGGLSFLVSGTSTLDDRRRTRRPFRLHLEVHVRLLERYG